MIKQDNKTFLENIRKPSDKELEYVSKVYSDFFKWRNERDGSFLQFQNKSFEDMLSSSRQVFWNTTKTASEDLEGLGLDFSIGFARKEVQDFLGRLTTLNIKPRFSGDGLDAYGVKILQSIYDKWRMKSNDKVEKFWQLLYGIVNGTVCTYIGYNDASMKARYLRKYDKASGQYEIEEKDRFMWDDVWEEIVPIEDIYLPKIFERNIQKQGKMIWKSQIPWKQFKSEFKNFDNAEYVYPGNNLAEDSLYFRLLSQSGITTTDKVEVIKMYDVLKDEFGVIANGVWLNPIGKSIIAPMPFNHKKLPFTWGILEPIDEKLAYGLPMPFKIKDPHKLRNISYTMLMERELRSMSPPVLTSDIEAPDLIFGDNKVIQVNDVNAYKEMDIKPASGDFFATLSSLQGIMSDQAQGGMSQGTGSKQPKSARENMQMEQLKQIYMSNTFLMYYDILRQEIDLVLKTAIQFYSSGKYRKQTGRIIRTLMVPNSSLMRGGVGNLEVRLVNKKEENPMNLYYESIQKSILNGKTTEIIEAPLEAFEELDFDIARIDLEQEKTTEMEQAAFMEQVLTPAVNVFMQMGLIDPQKLMMRWLDKMKEHPSDYVPEKIMGDFMGMWQKQYTPPQPGQPLYPQAQMPQNGGAQSGNMMQSQTGMQNGGQNMSPKFGAQNSQPIAQPA